MDHGGVVWSEDNVRKKLRCWRKADRKEDAWLERTWVAVPRGIFSNHQLTPVSRSQTALFGLLHLTSGSSFLLLLVFLIILIHHHHPALLHHRALVLDHLLAFLVAFSTLISKPSFSQSLSLQSHLSLLQAVLQELDHSLTRCLAVTGGGSVGECSRLSQSSWL